MTLESGYDTSIDEYRISDTRKCFFVLWIFAGCGGGRVSAIRSVMRLMRGYPETFQHVEALNDKSAAGDSAGVRDLHCIMKLDSALLLQSEKQNPVLLSEAVAISF